MKFILRDKITKELVKDCKDYIICCNGEIYHKNDIETPIEGLTIQTEVPLPYSNVPTIFNGDIITYKDEYDNYYREEVRDNCLFEFVEDGYHLLDYALDEIQLLDVDRNENGDMNGDFNFRLSIVEYPTTDSYDEQDLYEWVLDFINDGFVNGNTECVSPFKLIDELSLSNIQMKIKVKMGTTRILFVDIDRYEAKWKLECGHEFRI